MNLDYVVNRRFEPTLQSYDARDSALYALSLGIGDDPLDKDELPYVYEGREPRAVPSQCVTLGWPPFWHEELAAQISWRRILHGEQGFVLHRPLPLQGTIKGDHSVLAVEDKGVGRGALIHFATEISDQQTGEPFASLRSLQFLRDDGGCGAYGEPPPPSVAFHAEGEPTACLDYRTSKQARAALSPGQPRLHADPRGPGDRARRGLRAAYLARPQHLRPRVPRHSETLRTERARAAPIHVRALRQSRAARRHDPR